LPAASLRRLTLRRYGYDSTMAPASKTAVNVSFPSSYDAWRALATDPERYAQEKARIARDVIAAIDRRLLGFASQVEVSDVATP
jgi:phytoene dehydrogenase-like protein